LQRYGVAIRHLPLLSEPEDRRFHAGGVPRLDIALRARARLRRTLRDDADWEVSLIQRQVDLLPTLGLERLAARAPRVVLDVDDAIWLDRSREARGHALAVLKGTPRKLRWLARNADTVIAGNELLAEWLSRHSRNVVVIPSLVDPREIPMRRHEQGDRVVLGWIGSRSTAASLSRLRVPLSDLASHSGDLRFELLAVGGAAPDVPGIRVRSEPWNESREAEFLREVDIGLMPLPDDEWTKGKCAYKALQYMAAGIPVVADDVGVSAQVIGHDQAGLIAHDDDEWTRSLAALAADSQLRTRLGRKGRQQVETGYSVERWAPRLAEVLRGA
jgi:glycosyltransferase involved in cell wall biosynthesis